MMASERRTHHSGDLTLRVAESGPGAAHGYASMFDKQYRVGWFVERVSAGAFASTVAQSDIRALRNHDPEALLGRNRAGTLRLHEDDRGLRYEVDLPDTSLGRDTAVLLGRGDISGSSFGFRVDVDGDEWGETEDGATLRTIRSVTLRDVGPVTFPASDHTEAGIRTMEVFAETRSIPLDEVRSAVEAHHFGDLLDAGERKNWRPVRRRVA